MIFTIDNGNTPPYADKRLKIRSSGGAIIRVKQLQSPAAFEFLKQTKYNVSVYILRIILYNIMYSAKYVRPPDRLRFVTSDRRT